MATKLEPCPCCGKLTIEKPRLWEICPVCGWEDDRIQFDDPDYRGGANRFSLNEGKAAYSAGKSLWELQCNDHTEEE